MKIPAFTSLFDFSGKSVLITGGDKGIGRGIALRFTEAGADIAVTYRNGRAGAEEVCREAREMGRRSLAVECDQRNEKEVVSAVSAVCEKIGNPAVLVNNAGIYPTESLLNISEEIWDLIMDTNLKGVHFFTRAFASAVSSQGKNGSIVNIASIEGENPAPRHAHYNASKGGVIMYTKTAALELAAIGIRANSVSPGVIRSPGIEESWPDGVKRYISSAPLGRLGMPEDVADACIFLASSAARWITGINLRVDGGISAVPGY